MNRIDDKIEEILVFLEDLDEIIPESLDDYISNKEKKAACERYFEKILEAITDIAFYVIKMKGLRIPRDDGDSFEVLKENKIISDIFSKRLREAKSMRNIIAHEYGKIDDEVVFESIKEQLIPDVEEFIKQIKEFLKK
jgi:uncharacterized protein YutE (UPF0331/DUF86 family)